MVFLLLKNLSVHFLSTKPQKNCCADITPAHSSQKILLNLHATFFCPSSRCPFHIPLHLYGVPVIIGLHMPYLLIFLFLHDANHTLKYLQTLPLNFRNHPSSDRFPESIDLSHRSTSANRLFADARSCFIVAVCFCWPAHFSSMSSENNIQKAAYTTVASEAENPPALVKKIGRTSYIVRIHFSETSTETMSDTIKRMLKTSSRITAAPPALSKKICYPKPSMPPLRQSYAAVSPVSSSGSVSPSALGSSELSSVSGVTPLSSDTDSSLSTHTLPRSVPWIWNW